MRPPLVATGGGGMVEQRPREGNDMATTHRGNDFATTQRGAPVAFEPKAAPGWLTYAGILVLIGGVLDVIWGIAAIDRAHFFVANASYVISNLNLWGWVSLVIGAILIVAGLGIMKGVRWAIWVGLVFVSLNAIAQMMSIQAYPWWSLAVFALDVVAVYGLIAHGIIRSSE
jgi:hypothetical protein